MTHHFVIRVEPNHPAKKAPLAERLFCFPWRQSLRSVFPLPVHLAIFAVHFPAGIIRYVADFVFRLAGGVLDFAFDLMSSAFGLGLFITSPLTYLALNSASHLCQFSYDTIFVHSSSLIHSRPVCCSRAVYTAVRLHVMYWNAKA